MSKGTTWCCSRCGRREMELHPPVGCTACGAGRLYFVALDTKLPRLYKMAWLEID